MADLKTSILDMTKAVNNLSTHDRILADIGTQKYSSAKDNISKCNLFTDDVLKNYYGVDLPKRKEFASELGRISSNAGRVSGWGDNPASASVQSIFFDRASKLPNSGVSKVDAMQGSKLSAEGKPVLVLGAGHATLAAPHSKWPEVYRSDLANRGEDQRMTVGLSKDNQLEFYALDIEKYKRLRSIMQKFKGEDVIYDFEKGSKEIRKLLENN